MAEAKRGYVWLVCNNCKSQNYRTERMLRNIMRGDSAGPAACMTSQQKLTMKKYCKRCRAHTQHNESRKK